MRGCRLALIGLLLGPLQAGRAQAVPPPGTAVSARLEVEHWIEHRVIMGERVAEIARRYHVDVADVLKWNGLDADRPRLKAGMRLRILTAESAAQRKRRSYVVREGDTWTKIANRFGVPVSHLRNKWNRGVEEPVPGETLVVFVEVEPRPQSQAEPEPEPAPEPEAKAKPEPAPEPAPPAQNASASPQPRKQAMAAVVAPRAADPARPSAEVKPDVHVKASTARTTVASAAQPSSAAHAAAAKIIQQPVTAAATTGALQVPLVPVPVGALSWGAPARGRLRNGIQIPVNEALYTIRNPDNSWGSTHAIEQLQLAIARFRQDTGFDRQILVCDMSRKGGGRFRPHASHRSGRDVDIQLPVKKGMPEGHIPLTIGAVDWDATWALVRALVSTGEVKYIFLSRSRQRPLYQAALRAGETPDSLEGFIQYPDTERTALLRHSHGHVKHLHVRFTCAPYEERCVD